MSRCILDVIDRTVLSPRGGCFERLSAEQHAAAREMVRMLSDEAARVFVQRPDAKQTSLARRFKQTIEAHDDLLGGKP
jgi:hypothetical protein